MSYISGFVCAVPIGNKQAFIDHAGETAAFFKEYGALRIVDTWGEDVPDGELTSFPLAVKAEDNEVVAFSWVEWPSKDACDRCMTAMQTDPRMSPETNPMPFDGKRLIFGGFVPVLDTNAA
ncbi:MAG: DUF1428 domain-containing protein [Pseudomonadota bacterium]